MNECCSVAGVFFGGAAPFCWLFQKQLTLIKDTKSWQFSCFFVEKVPFFTTIYGMASKHRFWQRYVIIHIFLFCVDFLQFSSSPPFMGLGCMQSRTTNVGKKGVTTQTQWLHLSWYIDFRWGHFSQKSNPTIKRTHGNFGFWPPDAGWHLFVSPVTGCDFTATPKNWGKDARPRKQRRHQPGKVVLGRGKKTASLTCLHVGGKLSKKGVWVYKKKIWCYQSFILKYENVNFDHLWEENESNDCKLRDVLLIDDYIS